MSQIKSISLTRLLVASHNEFHLSAYKLMNAATAKVLHIETELPLYKAAIDLEMQIINYNQYLSNTQLLRELDAERSSLLSRLYTQIDMAARSPIDAEKTAGAALKIIISPYRGIANNEYTKETAQIRGLLRDLATQEALEYLGALSANTVVSMLRQANNSFAAAMEERITVEAARPQRQINISRYQHQKVVNRLYREIIYIINSFAIAIPTDEIDTFIDLMNALIDQYKRVIASQRPGGTGNEKGGGNKPDDEGTGGTDTKGAEDVKQQNKEEYDNDSKDN